MLKLLKYEWKKTWMLKVGLLIITGILEALYLFGLFGENGDALGLSVLGLTFAAIIGIIMVGAYNVEKLYKELNSKESYMMFMTPHSSYEILGAKVMESAISVIGTGLVFALLAILDLQLLNQYVDYETNLVMYIITAFGLNQLTPVQIITVFCSQATNFLMVFTAAYLVVIIGATLLNGKKSSGWLSFFLFLVIYGLIQYGMGYFLGSVNMGMMTTMQVSAAIYLVLTVIFYGIAGYLMDHKLSV